MVQKLILNENITVIHNISLFSNNEANEVTYPNRIPHNITKLSLLLDDRTICVSPYQKNTMATKMTVIEPKVVAMATTIPSVSVMRTEVGWIGLQDEWLVFGQ